MKRPTRVLICAVAAAILALPLAGSAGTAGAPEIADPRGDAKSLLAGGADAAWGDITSMWFSSVRDELGKLRAFQVHLGLASTVLPPGGMTRGFELMWDVGDCNDSIHLDSPSSVGVDANGVVYSSGPERAEVSSSCNGESMDKEVDFWRGEQELTFTVPLATFSGWAAIEHIEGAFIRPYAARSYELPCICPPTLIDEAPDLCVEPTIFTTTVSTTCLGGNPRLDRAPEQPRVYVLGS